MTPPLPLSRITETLKESDLSWLLPNLRQDLCVWDALNDPAFLDRLEQSREAGVPYEAQDFTPSKLALVALGQVNDYSHSPEITYGVVGDELVQLALHKTQDESIFDYKQQDLANAGLISLALLHGFIQTNSWQGLLFEIRQHDPRVWLAPLACLYGYLENPTGLLRALVQPGAGKLRFQLAIHTLLSNPLSQAEMVSVLMGLCHGNFNDPLPAGDRLGLLHELLEQNPHIAQAFGNRWLEMHPGEVKLADDSSTSPIETIHLLVENLFQIELRRICKDVSGLDGILSNQKFLAQNLHADLIQHYFSQLPQVSTQNLSADESLELLQPALQSAQGSIKKGTYSAKVVRLAPSLAALGLTQEAQSLLPAAGDALPEDPEALYAIARVWQDVENHPGACEAVSQLISQLGDPEKLNGIPVWGTNLSRVNLGKIYLLQHQVEAASRVFESAVHTCPNDPQLLHLLVESYAQARNYQGVTEVLHVLLALDPTCLDDHRSLAHAYEELNDWEASLQEREVILLAMNADGNSPDIQDRYAYAHSALKANQPGLALKVCQQLLQENEEDYQALVYTGEAYLAMNDFERGMQTLTQATQVAPQLAEAWLALASAQKVNYPVATVIETLKTAAQSVTDSALIHYFLGELYVQDNTPSLALHELQLAAHICPTNPQFLLSFGKVLSTLGHLEESCDTLSRAYKLEPAFPGLAKAYARNLVELGRLEEAIAPFEFLLNTNPETEIGTRLEYARCVLSLLRMGVTTQSPMKALIALNEVLQSEPENSEAKALTAEALSANGEHELAFQAFREALDTPLTEDQAWSERLSYGFGCSASSIGKHDIAIAALQEAGQINPSNPAIFKALSDTYLSANLPDEALRAARNVLVIDSDNPDQLSWFASQATRLIQAEKSSASSTATGETRQAPEEALNALAKAIQLAPTRSDLIVQLANFQASLGEQSEAQKIFASIASHAFATIADLKTSAHYLGTHGDHASAIECLEKGIGLDLETSQAHDPSLYTCLAQEYVQQHDHASAISTLDRAIELLPQAGNLVTEKIDLLLKLGQPLEALQVIDTALTKELAGNLKAELSFLGAHIERLIGNLAQAVKYARMGVISFGKEGPHKNISSLPLAQRTQLAEMYRALLQPEAAYHLIDLESSQLAACPKDSQEFIHFICLHTELALETGERISEEFQDVKLEAMHPAFCRLMAINARLMNKAGNYKQAVQLFQLAENHLARYINELPPNDWGSDYQLALNQISLCEAAQDLALWDQAWNYAQQLATITQAEPLSKIQLAKTIIQKTEYSQLCEVFEVIQHKPETSGTPSELIASCMGYLDQAKSDLAHFLAEPPMPQFELNQDQLYRWQARADNAFDLQDTLSHDPGEILAGQQTTADLAACVDHLHKSMQNDPDGVALPQIIKIARQYSRSPAIILQAALALQPSNPEEATRSLQAVIEHNPSAKNPGMAFCNILLARLTSAQEQYTLAHNAVEAALDFWPDEPAWHMLAAHIYQNSSDIHATMQHLAAATELAPDVHAYHFELGKTYLENACEDPQMLGLALKSLQRACTLQPEHADSFVYLANTYNRLDNLEQAEEHARQALLLDPNRTEVYQLLSQVAIHREDFQGAYEYASKAMQLSPRDVQSTISLAKALSALGRHSEALARLNTLISSSPETLVLQLERVNLIKKINGSHAALEELTQLTSVYPDDFSVLSAQAKAFIEVGEPENAIGAAQQALKVCDQKTSLPEQANLHLLAGQILRQSGQLDQSIQHLSEAIQLAPNRLEPYLELGLARKERREFQQALQIFEQATQVAPDDPRAPYEAGLALKESKDYKSSETMLRRAVSLAPNNLLIRRQLAAVVALNLVHNPRSGRNNPSP